MRPLLDRNKKQFLCLFLDPPGDPGKAYHTFVSVPVFVHLQNADSTLTSPLRFNPFGVPKSLPYKLELNLSPKRVSSCKGVKSNRGLADLLGRNPVTFGQESEIATQESTALFALFLTWVVRDLPVPVQFLFLRRWVSTFAEKNSTQEKSK